MCGLFPLSALDALSEQLVDPAVAWARLPAQRENPTLAKGRKVILPNVDFQNVPVREAVDYLRQLAAKVDSEPDPRKKGFNIFIMGDFGDAKVKKKDVSFDEAARLLAKSAELDLRVPYGAYQLYVPADPNGELYTVVYELPLTVTALFAEADQEKLKALLAEKGVKFPEESSVRFFDANKIAVHNNAKAQRVLAPMLARAGEDNEPEAD
jgi:hypothetical protein